ncbi:MAG: SUMF1/EgtB/PvdO family nonheme iron enzyme [Chthoniobacterales bacterium]
MILPKLLFLLLSLFVMRCAHSSEPSYKLTLSKLEELKPINIECMLVGDPGNSADIVTQLGAVAATYYIGKYEVTVAEWCAFLNAVATQGDPHGLYDTRMTYDPLVASIEYQRNDDGSYHYNPITGRDLFPITYVSYHNALRFCNWYQNGQLNRQQGDQLAQMSTENGAYTFNIVDGEEKALPSEDARYFLPTEDQWIKAAYYAGGGLDQKYWLYPTQHDAPPNHGDPANMIDDGEGFYSNIATVSNNIVIRPVNFFEETQGAYGTRDMGGNVTEWITRIDRNNPEKFVPITRGASWASPSSEDSRRTAAAQTYDHAAVALGNNKTGFRIATLFPVEASSYAAVKTDLVKKPDSHKESENKSHLKLLEDVLQWSLFFIDLATLGLMLGGVLSAALLVLLGPEIFALALVQLPLLELFFSAEVPFSVAMLLTLFSFLMDWITNDGYAFDVFFFIMDLLKFCI